MKRKLYCYSAQDFKELVDSGFDFSNWAVVSISEPNVNVHCLADADNVLNINFHDVSPELWWRKNNSKVIDYDTEYDAWVTAGNQDNFNLEHHPYNIHAMDYDDAMKIALFLNRHIENAKNIIVHCKAGISRSQGVIAYVLMNYNFDWETRKENPCLTPNIHVKRMLNRIARSVL